MLILLIAIEVKITQDCIVIKFVVSVVLFWVEVPSPIPRVPKFLIPYFIRIAMMKY
jgi:hypothetical protein